MSSEPDGSAYCTDEELLARFQRGEKSLFGTLVKRYQHEIFGYLRRYLRRFVEDPSLADDVFQATFLHCTSRAGQYEEGRPVRPWLYTIATHQAIDALRRAGRRPTASLDQAGDEGGEERSLTDLLESREPNPLEQSQAEERKAILHGWVDRLPEFLRQVVILGYFQGPGSTAMIADVLEIPVGTVKSRLHTAVARLQDLGRELASLPAE